jgi:methylamine dehydrogenase accessory protein MauD
MSLTTIVLLLAWAAILILAVCVLALVRQVGMLHERVAPAGALSLEKQSLHAGEPVPEFALRALDGRFVTIGGVQPEGRSTLVFFLSDTCPVCKTLLPVLKALRTQEAAWLDIVLASDGDEDAHRKFVSKQHLEAFHYVLSQDLGMAFEVAKLPYGVLVDESGQLVAHGLLNNREHLDSLLEARSLGVSTVQEFAGRDAA